MGSFSHTRTLIAELHLYVKNRETEKEKNDMELKSNKCVMVIDEALPLGIIANTAGIMGITLGKYIPETIGPEVVDKSGSSHLGIIQIPVPVLKADKGKLKEIRERLYQPEFECLIVVDFSDVAQSCNVYEDYIQKASAVEEKDFNYFGVGICGEKKLVNKLTGNLPLLR